MTSPPKSLSPRGLVGVPCQTIRLKAIADSSSGDSELVFKKGDLILLREKDGFGWGEGETQDGAVGWFSLALVDINEEESPLPPHSPREPLSPRIQTTEPSLHNNDLSRFRQDTLTNFLAKRPLRDSLVDKKILPNAQTQNAIQNAQKRYQKQQLRKGKPKNETDILQIYNEFESSGSKRNLQHLLKGLNETYVDEIVLSLLDIPVTKIKQSLFSGVIENAFLGSVLLEHIKNDKLFRRLFSLDDAVHFYAKEETAYIEVAEYLIERNILTCASGERKFSKKDAYQVTAKLTEYGVINVDKFWGGDKKDAYETSIELLTEISAIYQLYLPDFNALRNSREIKRFGLHLTTLQKLDFSNTSKDRKKIYHINLFNIMVLYSHAKFSPPVSMVDRKYLYENCELLINQLRFSLEALEVRAVKEGHGKDPLIYFCLSDCTLQSAPIYVFRLEEFEEQQKHAARYLLMKTVLINENEYEITLPRICQRIWKELNIEKESLVDIIKPLLDENSRKQVDMMSSVGKVQIKFSGTAFDPSYVFDQQSCKPRIKEN